MNLKEWKSKKLDEVDRIKRDSEISFWQMEAENLFLAKSEVENNLKNLFEENLKLTKEIEILNTIIDDKEALIKQLIAFNEETQK